MVRPAYPLRDDSAVHPFGAPLEAVNITHAARVYFLKLRASIYQNGAVSLTLNDLPSADQLSEALIHLFLVPIQTVPMPDAVRNDPIPHTVLPSRAVTPPFVALLNRSQSTASLSLAPIASVLPLFTPESASVLRTTKLHWEDTDVSHPILITHRRLRFDTTLMVASALAPIKAERFTLACAELSDLLKDECLLSRNNLSLPPASITLFDNHRFAHRLHEPEGTGIDAVAFDFPSAPELEAALLKAYRCPLYKPDLAKARPSPADDLGSLLYLSSWPVTKSRP